MIAALMVAWQGNVALASNDGSFVLRNFAARGISIDFATGETTFEGRGNPLVLQQLDEGLTLSSLMMRGTAVNTAKGAYTPKTAEATGEARLIVDSVAADKFRAEHHLPAGPEGLRRVHLVSESIAMAVEPAGRRVSLANPFVLLQHTEGRAVTGNPPKPMTFRQDWDFRGTKGDFLLVTSGNATRPREGTVEGPVTVRMSRTETVTGVPLPRESTLNARADRLLLSTEGENTVITAKGHVHIDGTGTFSARIDDVDEMIITLDPDLKPLRMRASGQPSTSTLRNLGGPR